MKYLIEFESKEEMDSFLNKDSVTHTSAPAIEMNKKMCEIHNVWMQEKQSKFKKDENGNPKTYFSHSIKNADKWEPCYGDKEDPTDKWPSKNVECAMEDCETPHVAVPESVIKFSKSKYGKIVCFKCQQKL